MILLAAATACAAVRGCSHALAGFPGFGMNDFDILDRMDPVFGGSDAIRPDPVLIKGWGETHLDKEHRAGAADHVMAIANIGKPGTAPDSFALSFKIMQTGRRDRECSSLTGRISLSIVVLTRFGIQKAAGPWLAA
ncbi:MAG: hypothetical protein OXC91_02410 [Rhodobacteraceae bacterium]|nr:hypothetical protein [Paracoccaceae bacterium]